MKHPTVWRLGYLHFRYLKQFVNLFLYNYPLGGGLDLDLEAQNKQ